MFIIAVVAIFHTEVTFGTKYHILAWISCQHTDTAYVRIFVTDVNDNAPAFSQPVCEISVEEDKEVGFVVITVTANDEDEGNSHRTQTSYSILSFVGGFCFSVLFVPQLFLTAHWYFWQIWSRRSWKKKLWNISRWKICVFLCWAC